MGSGFKAGASWIRAVLMRWPRRPSTHIRAPPAPQHLSPTLPGNGRTVAHLRPSCRVSGFHAEIPAHGLGAIGGSELPENVLDVRLDRAFRNDQPRGDAGVGLAGGHEPQDADLASSQL